MSRLHRPAGVTANRRERTVIINWEDGHRSIYSFDGLRAACPCVECRGGQAVMGLGPEPDEVRKAPSTVLTLEGMDAVGGYALQFSWGDGHSAGIFTWELLRDLCPCQECSPK